jgi:hypothetical protein
MTQPLPRTYQEARWLDDLDPSGAETASDLESLQQDVLHIIEETLGSNLADPDKGIGAQNYLSGSAGQLLAMPSKIDEQLGHVSRITNSRTSVSQQSDGSYLVAIVAAIQGSIVSFNFTLGPNGLSVAGPVST